MDNNNQITEFEDISSSSHKNRVKEIKDITVKAVENYGNGAAKHMDSIIKAISFIVAIAMLLIFLVLAALLYILDSSFLVVAIGVAVIGIVISLIILFLIYGLGHIISQNNEIIKKL